MIDYGMIDYGGSSKHERSFRIVTGENDLPNLDLLDQHRGGAVKSCGVVVPCYNEARRLDVSKFADFARRSNDLELIFVNDGSSDDTLTRICEVYEHASESVNVLSLTPNCGKGEAVRRGMIWAAARGFSTIGFWDADLATPLETIYGFHDVFRKYSQVDVVWGTRLCLLGHFIERDFVRRQIGRMFSSASATAVGVGIRDALCGAKMFRNGKMLCSVLAKPYSSRWIFDVEILARLRILSNENQGKPLQESMYEYPLDQWFEMAGSKLRPVDFVRAASELTSLFWRYRVHPKVVRRDLLVDQVVDYQLLSKQFACEVVREAVRPAKRSRQAA